MTAKKFRFNIIDAIILLILVAAIAVFAYIFVFSDDTEQKGEPHTVEYTLLVTSVDGIFKESVKEEMKVSLNSDRKTVLGEVVGYQYGGSVKTEFNKKPGDDAAEVYTVIDADRLVDMVITFRAETELTEQGYCIDDDFYLIVNNSHDFLIGNFRCNATCIGVKKID